MLTGVKEAFTWLPRARESKPKRMTRLTLKHSSRPVCRVLPGGLRFALAFTSVFVNSIVRLPFLDSSVLSIKRLLVAGVFTSTFLSYSLVMWPPVLASARCELALKLAESGSQPAVSHPVGTMVFLDVALH